MPGFEGSGVVREAGPAVTGISVGDRVLAFGGRPGFYAEYVVVPQGHVVSVPEALDWDSAAALPVAPSRPGTACVTSLNFGAARKYSSGRRQAVSVMRLSRSPNTWARR